MNDLLHLGTYIHVISQTRSTNIFSFYIPLENWQQIKDMNSAMYKQPSKSGNFQGVPQGVSTVLADLNGLMNFLIN